MNSVYDDPAYDGVRDSLTDLLLALQEQYGEDPNLFTQNLEKKTMDHLARGAYVQFVNPPDERYAQNAKSALTDGTYWHYTMYAPIRMRDWLGWRNRSCEVILDLGSEKAVKDIRINTYQSPRSWVYVPERVDCFVSLNGKNFERAGGVTTMDNTFLDGTKLYEVNMPGKQVRYVKVLIKPMQYIPSGMPGGGNAPWLFVDEVIVE